MIDRSRLLEDLRPLLRLLENDLLERSESPQLPDIGTSLRSEFERARKADRTAQNYTDWRAAAITQAAVSWVLSCVFARFLEDNQLVDPPRLSGPGEAHRRSQDERESYFRAHPTETDREYLLHTFDSLATLPGAADLFGPRNSLRERPNWLSGDAAGALLAFFRKLDPGAGALIHDFSDQQWDTRFLGDLYQDLSESARKKYALLQTPEFVEEFILDRTLDPALDEFGLPEFKMIDPACGSGHFVLGSFARILNRLQRQEPASNVRVLVQRALDSVHGVDLNPYAIAIARFRLLLAALRASGIRRLRDAPDFHLNLACGDSLLHAPHLDENLSLDFALTHDVECNHAYQSEDLPAVKKMLQAGRYHTVVANPPYITPKDPGLNARYRLRFASCHRQYALTIPFMEQLFRLAIRGNGSGPGFVGQITSNSFMKRQFGKKLIEEFFPRVDLTYIIDTSLAYVPGHGTPTVIILGRNRHAIASMIRTVMGIKREDCQPNDPSRGLVWLSILQHVDDPLSDDDYVTVRDSPRTSFHEHPWSIRGGGAAELKVQLDEAGKSTLRDACEEIGFGAVTREDEAYLVSKPVARRHRIELSFIRALVEGDRIRDWGIHQPEDAIWPYDSESLRAQYSSHVCRVLWPLRLQLCQRVAYGLSQVGRGLAWYEYSMFFRQRYRVPMSIAFAFVATHNHFVLDLGGRMFKQSAPLIKLPEHESEDRHLQLLGPLNSSVGAFWMRQVFHDKGGGGIGGGIAAESWERFFEYDGTKLGKFPLPGKMGCSLARNLDTLSRVFYDALNSGWNGALQTTSIDEEFSKRYRIWTATLQQIVALQEELDWQCYRLYKLLPDKSLEYGEDPPPTALGERAFEIVMARKIAAGELETTWFSRHNSNPITELPSHWPGDYRRLVERRIACIESNSNISLIEQPEYKRRWNTEPWDSQLKRALRDWLLNRLESYFDFDGRMNDDRKATARFDTSLLSTARLTDAARHDPDFMQVAALYCEDPAFDPQQLVDELVASESVPFLPVLRYKPTGLIKRAEWEKTWDLQRAEDRIEQELKAAFTFEGGAPEPDTQISAWRAENNRTAYAAFFDSIEDMIAGSSPQTTQLAFKDLVRRAQQRSLGDIPVPPRYTSADFQETTYWRLRGKLDVPKERWISFPHCEGPDGSPVIAWAGYDHLQLATAISAYFVDVHERFGGADDPRLTPLLAGLIEILPWLMQWHNDIDPDFGVPMGDYYQSFIEEEARRLNKTLDEIRAWQPPARSTRRRKEPTPKSAHSPKSLRPTTSLFNEHQ